MVYDNITRNKRRDVSVYAMMIKAIFKVWLRSFFVPPWLYDIKDSVVLLHLKEEIEINVESNPNLLKILKDKKPYIKIFESGGGFIRCTNRR